MSASSHPTRKLTIIAQDPSVRAGGRILRSLVELPAERIEPGPAGSRIFVAGPAALDGDAFATAADAELLADRRFHAQNLYAIVMRTLGCFEFALGRRMSWAFDSHRLRLDPRAFEEANAYYTAQDGALRFGWFQGRHGPIHSCLSHDVIAHETAHALLDGLRQRYSDPSSPDQAAFHEGFADLVALLSVFSLPDAVPALMDRGRKKPITAENLRRGALFGLAEEMGREITRMRGGALRQPALLEPSPHWLYTPEFQEPHRRGEVLAAAGLNAFLAIWMGRLGEQRDPGRVAEEGRRAASHLLTMCIRAIDYAPPTDIEFPDYLSALLTADAEMQPDDSRFGYREALRRSFADYGIEPASRMDGGLWEPPDRPLSYERVHREPLHRDPEEVFRFLWENAGALSVCEGAETRVQSVRPCLRIGSDGFLLRETAAEYVQTLTLPASGLTRLGIRAPEWMPADMPVTLYGGGALIFDEYGRLKYHARNRIDNPVRQTRRLEHLWNSGALAPDGAQPLDFQKLHRRRWANS